MRNENDLRSILKNQLFLITVLVIFTAGCQMTSREKTPAGVIATPSELEVSDYLTRQAKATPLPTKTPDLELEKRQTEIAQNPDWIHMVATDPISFKIASGKYQLVEKMAFWCTECRDLNPVLKSLEGEWGQRIDFVYLDVDDPLNTENIQKISRLKVVPEVVLLDGNGKILKDWIGPPTREELVSEFEKLP
jgi:thiol-disulfide isomerase/thioredoxin